jgi:hypothetical protein
LQPSRQEKQQLLEAFSLMETLHFVLAPMAWQLRCSSSAQHQDLSQAGRGEVRTHAGDVIHIVNSDIVCTFGCRLPVAGF